MSDILGHLEEQVLLAVQSLKDNAYGVTIREEIEKCTGRKISYGTVSITLMRLQKKDFVSSWVSGPVKVRGGRSKRYYKIEGEGVEALFRTRQLRDKLTNWPGVPNYV